MAKGHSKARADVRAHFQELAAEAQEFASTEAAAAGEPTSLGEWAEDQRGCPNVVLRSALFTAGKPTKARKLFRDHALPAAIGTDAISYTGAQLYQHELDVWLEILHRCRAQRDGIEASFHVYGFLRSLRRSVGNTDHKQLHATLDLLHATSVHVVLSRDERGRAQGYRGHLVEKSRYNDVTHCWEVGVHPDIAELFVPTSHTWLHFDARLDLGKNFLAKWIHGYFSSHRKPYPISVRRLRDLSGSATADLRRFRQALRVALVRIGEVERGHGRRFSWRVDPDDLVHVMRESGN
jgi:hypothetical protein